jgi:tryptophan 2,3-dioxygenase
MTLPSRPSPRPDGIGPAHEHPPSGPWRRIRPLLSLTVLGGVVAWALSGQAGGRSETRTAEAPAATLQVRMPAIIRTGQFYEATVTVRARRDIDRPTLAVESGLWRDVTINSAVPAPSEESYRDGRVRFAFDRLAAGETLVFKVDAQINPSRWGTNAGRFALLDGDAPLAALPLSQRILP